MAHAIFWFTGGLVAFLFGVFRVAMAAAHRTAGSIGAWFVVAGLAAMLYGIVAGVRSMRAPKTESSGT